MKKRVDFYFKRAIFHPLANNIVLHKVFNPQYAVYNKQSEWKKRIHLKHTQYEAQPPYIRRGVRLYSSTLRI